MDDITIGVTEFVNNILVSAQPNDQTIDITVTETVETVLLDVSTTVQEVTVTATQNVIVENITVDYVNNENNIDINVTDGTQDVTLNVTPTLVEINILRSGGEVNILQFNTLADFPSTGSSDYFYLAKDTNKLYRWTGSAYAEISATSSPVWGQIIGTLSEQTDLQNALNLKASINSPTFTGTVSGITKAMVGLAQVDNTSDLDKPISTATQTALNNKQPLDGDLTSIAALSGTFGLLKKTANNSYTIDTNTYLTGITSSDVTTALGFTPENVANKGIANGYASLNGDGKVPSSQLPSYVDDVIEVSSFGTLPTTGETGKIYITLDTNKIYRWSGSVYVEVSSSAAVWGGITGTLSAQTDLQSALNAKENTITAGTTAQYYRGDKTFQTLDTSVVPEGSNLYFTDARVNANGNVTANTAARHNAVTLGTANGLSLSTQVLSLGLSSGSTTGALSSTDWTTFNNKYPASNPNGYTSNVGTVTSVAMTVPSAFSVSGSPITSSGTLAVTATGNTTQYIAGDGSLVTFPTIGTAGTLTREVRNTTGATLTKGTVVYISGATGNKPTVSKAIATGDSTSAQTFGLVQADIANNANGNVVCVGDLTGLDTSAFTEGVQLYLSSTTAGAYTTTKQLAPNHLVYIGVVTRSHPTLGQIEVNIQNGYELYELHDVSITSVANNQGLFYEASTDLWKNKSIATVLGYTPANGADYVPLSGDQSISGIKNFTGFAQFENGVYIKQGTGLSAIAGYNLIDADTTGIYLTLPNLTSNVHLNLSNVTAQRDIYLPNSDGTLALLSDIPSLSGYVTTTGNQSISGTKTFTTQLHANVLKFSESGGFNQTAGFTQIGGTADYFTFANGTNAKSAQFTYGTGTAFNLPNSNGTIALTSDLHNAVTIGTANGLSLSTQVLSLGLASTSATGALSSTDWNTFNGKQSAISFSAPLANIGGLIKIEKANSTTDGYLSQGDWSTFNNKQNALTNPVTGTGTTSYLPKFTGTSAIGNSLLYDTGSVLLVGATSASDGQSKLELVSGATVGLKIISTGANGNNTFLSIQSSKEWRFVTNRGDLIGGNQGDLIIRNNTDGINHIILNQGGGTTFAGALNGTSATFSSTLSASSTTLTASANTYAGGALRLNSFTGGTSIYLTSSGGVFALSNGGGADHLLIASTGAATFSSSVTAGAGLASGNALVLSNGTNARQFQLGYSTGAGYNYFQVYDGAAFQPLMVNNTLYLNASGNVGIGTTTFPVFTGSQQMTMKGGSSNTNSVFQVQSFDAGTSLTIYSGAGASDDPAIIFQKNLRFGSATNTGLGGYSERMRITSAGNVGISTTSPSYKFDVQNGSDFDIRLRDTSLGGTVGILFETANDFSGTSQAYIKGIGAGNSGVSQLIFGTAGSSGDTTATERMRITSGGNVLVGTTSATASVFSFQVGNGTADTRGFFNPNNPYSIGLANGTSSAWYIGVNAATTANGLQFYSNELGAAAMTVTTAGNLLVGSSSTAYAATNRKVFEVNGATSSLIALKSGDVKQGYFFVTSNGGDMYFTKDTGTNSFIFQNQSNGVYMTVGATGWSSISDIRLKNINSNIENAVDSLMTLKAINYSWKSDADKKENLGLIAQEVEKIFPQIISKSKFKGNNASNINDDDTEYLSVRYTELVPVLVKAIQELKAELDTLKNK